MWFIWAPPRRAATLYLLINPYAYAESNLSGADQLDAGVRAANAGSPAFRLCQLRPRFTAAIMLKIPLLAIEDAGLSQPLSPFYAATAQAGWATADELDLFPSLQAAVHRPAFFYRLWSLGAPRYGDVSVHAADYGMRAHPRFSITAKCAAISLISTISSRACSRRSSTILRPATEHPPAHAL